MINMTNKAWRLAGACLVVLACLVGATAACRSSSPTVGASNPQVPNSGDAGYVLTSLGVNQGYSNQPGGNPNVGIGIYGDGSDGAAVADGSSTIACVGAPTFSGTYTQSRDCYFTNLTINGGVTWLSAGHRKFVNGTLTCNGHISVDGGNAFISVDAGSAGGVAGGWDSINGPYTNQALGGGRGGCTGGGTYSNLANSMGGDGGFGSSGESLGVTKPLAFLGSPHELQNAIRGNLTGASNINNPPTSPAPIVIVGGNCGGGGNNTGPTADGGGGAGVDITVALNLAGSGSITANGGQGAGPILPDVNSGGGGGGGFEVVVTRNQSAWSGTISALGGACCGGAPPSSGASNGDNGTVIQFTE